MGEWPLMTVGELADSISDTHKMEKDRLIFLNTSDILYGNILHRSYSAVRDWPGQAKKSIQRGDVLFSEIRPANGRWAYVDIDSHDYVVSTKLMVIRGRENLVNPRYLYHFLTSAVITRWLQHLAESRSGTFPQITFDQIASLEIALPSLPIQGEIVGFLDAIGNKIELIRKTNETLEKMAQVIFRSWFVDFDPVRAKMEGRDTGLPKEIADLFPNSFEDSELGEIPKGWKMSAISDLAKIVGGGTPRTSEADYWRDGVHHWVTPKDLSALNFPVLLNTERRITDAGLAQISSGLLPIGTVLLSSRAPIGYLAINEVPVAINQGFIAMKPLEGLSNLFLLLWARSAHEEILSYANGSTFLEINKANFRTIPVVVPPAAVLHMFDHVVRPMYQKIVSNERDSHTLVTLRDTLLPKLMSGELQLSSGEQFIARSV